jgi:RHS repeat-associated protein
MKNQFTMRAIASALIFTLTYTPILGAISGTAAAAQTVQTSTYAYQYDANGNVTQITDPLGRVTDLAYDALGRSTQQTLPAPQASVTRPVVQYGYDGQDQLLTVTDPRKLVTAYTVDGLGNQGALESPDTGRTSNTYDLAGNLKTSMDARGKVSTYSYDAINRVTRIDYVTGPSTVFEYDGGMAGLKNAIGKLTGMTDESGNTAYAYDAFGRLLSKTQTIVVGNTTRAFTVGYAYGTNGTATGKLASVTYPSGNRVNYIYDAAGQLSRMTLDPAVAADGTTPAGASVPLLTGIYYAPFGGVQSWYWGNSTDTAENGYARTFDLDGRIASYTLGNAQTTGVLRHVNYDAAGRILDYTHEGTNAATSVALDQTFAYDGLDRLTGNQSATTSLSFAYDANGNRTQATIGGNNYSNVIGATSNRLMSTAGPAPAKTNSYDAAGSLTSDGTVTYVYSDRGRLARADKDGLTTTYLYNGIGQRMAKNGSVVQSGANYFVYDEQGHVLGEYGLTGTALKETVYLGNTPVVVLGSGISYVYTDHLDTPRLITRSSDNLVVWRWDLADPFGMQQPLENPSGSGTFTYNLRFPGQIFDRETNNHYNYHRDYDPQTGRYIQSDPIGLDGGINTYGYGLANPISNVDPTGLLVPPGLPAGVFAARPVVGFGPVIAAASAAFSAGMATYAYCHKDDDEECKKIIEEIYAAMNVVEGRLSDMYVDSIGLYTKAYDRPSPSLPKGTGSWTGHATQAGGWQRRLRKLIDEAVKKGCKVPPYAWDLAKAPIPERPALPPK